MPLGVSEQKYDAATLRRNRIVVATLTIAAVASLVVAGVTTSWPTTNAIGSAAIALVFGCCLWWMFGSRNAGSVRFTKSLDQIANETFGDG